MNFGSRVKIKNVRFNELHKKVQKRRTKWFSRIKFRVFKTETEIKRNKIKKIKKNILCRYLDEFCQKKLIFHKVAEIA